MTSQHATAAGGGGLPDSAGDRRLAVLVAFGALFAVYSYGYDLWKLPPQVVEFGTVGRTLAGDVLPMLLAPIAVALLVLRLPLAEIGFRARPLAPLLRAGALAWLAVLPLVVWMSTRPEVQAFYPSPRFPPAREHWIGLAFLWGLHHVPQLLSVECLYRGFLLQPLAKRFGFAVATSLVVAPYVLLHWTKPPVELALAAWGGVVFSWAAWRTRSFLPAFLAHWLTAVTMDVLCFLQLR